MRLQDRNKLNCIPLKNLAKAGNLNLKKITNSSAFENILGAPRQDLRIYDTKELLRQLLTKLAKSDIDNKHEFTIQTVLGSGVQEESQNSRDI